MHELEKVRERAVQVCASTCVRTCVRTCLRACVRACVRSNYSQKMIGGMPQGDKQKKNLSRKKI